jgi:hypothetical protein
LVKVIEVGLTSLKLTCSRYTSEHRLRELTDDITGPAVVEVSVEVVCFIDQAITVIVDQITEINAFRGECASILAAVGEVLIDVIKIEFTGDHCALSLDAGYLGLRQETRDSTGATVVEVCGEIKALVSGPITVVVKLITAHL